jgi:hypothetical protein
LGERGYRRLQRANARRLPHQQRDRHHRHRESKEEQQDDQRFHRKAEKAALLAARHRRMHAHKPVGASMNFHGNANRSARCAASAFTPNVSVA